MSLRYLFASTCNLWRQLFRNLGMKITTIVWVDSKNNGWLPWIPFPHQTTDPLRWKTRPGMSEDTYPCSWSVRELMFQLIMSLLKASWSASVISWLKNNAFHNKKLQGRYGYFIHKSGKFCIAFFQGFYYPSNFTLHVKFQLLRYGGFTIHFRRDKPWNIPLSKAWFLFNVSYIFAMKNKVIKSLIKRSSFN